MSKIQLLHPAGQAGFTHEGQSFESDEDGLIEIPAHFADHAKAHGFEDIIEAGDSDVEEVDAETGKKPLRKPAKATTLKK